MNSIWKRRAAGLGLLALAVAVGVTVFSVAGAGAGKAIEVGSSARTDALHERKPMVAQQRPQSCQELGLRHRASWVRLRDAVPLRPAQAISSSRGLRPRERGCRRPRYVMTIRKGVKWSDGKTLTPSDVKYSFDLAKIATHPQHALWQDTGLKSTSVNGNTVVFKFAGQSRVSAVRLLPLHGRDRPAAHLQGLHRYGHRHRQPRRHEQDRRHRAVPPTSPGSAPARRRWCG